MTNINTIVTDMDGTLLLKAGDAIHPLNKEVLGEWQAEGNRLFLATGRLDLAILKFIHELNITTPVISCNGGLIRDFTKNKILYKSDISLDLVKEVLATIHAQGLDFHIYTTERILGPSKSGKIAFFDKLNETLPENEQVPLTISADPLAELKEGEFPLKILVIEESKEKQAEIKEALSGLPLSVLSSASNLVDIMNKGIDKENGLRYLASQGYIDLTTTAAFGDNENDAGMLEASQIGVAVANAIPTTLERADEVTLDNESGGVGVYIQEKLLGNK